MRITRDTLLKVVRDTVTQRTRTDRSLVSVYLCGSLLEEDYLLGGTTDIDLVFIHADLVAMQREIVPLTEGVHLDIAHHLHKDYRQARSLRVHPWLGPTLNKCNVLHDPQHFLDFTQASVRGQFDRSDYVYERARRQAEHARQIWLAFHNDKPEPGPKEIARYLRSVEHAANAVASLSGHPLTERRFLLRFPERAEAVGRPGLFPGLLGLLGAPNVTPEILQSWLPEWQSAYESLSGEQAPARLHPARLAYYQRAFESMLKSDNPHAVLWPLLRTWTVITIELPENKEVQSGWQAALERLGLSGDGFEERIAATDAYLDLVEETLETWAEKNGAFL